MRNIIVISTMVFLGLLTLMILNTIYGRLDRKMELESNLSSIVEEVVEDMVLHALDEGIRNENIAEELTQMLFKTIDASSDINVDVLGCDMKKGLLFVRVTLSYRHPNGDNGTILCEKCVILNQVVQEEERKCRVSFYVGSDLYKEFVVSKETMLAAPVSPVLNEGSFYGWVDETGRTVDFSKPILQDTICYAIAG